MIKSSEHRSLSDVILTILLRINKQRRACKGKNTIKCMS
jgi:hypothetical protein